MKSYIPSNNFGSHDYRQLCNSILKKNKSSISPHFKKKKNYIDSYQNIASKLCLEGPYAFITNTHQRHSPKQVRAQQSPELFVLWSFSLHPEKESPTHRQVSTLAINYSCRLKNISRNQTVIVTFGSFYGIKLLIVFTTAFILSIHNFFSVF